MSSVEDLKIFVVKHKDYWYPSNSNVFQSVGVGGYDGAGAGESVLADSSGDNISAKNPNYCELTAMYWVWKNVDLPEYVGFCHYRRYFAFDSRKRNWLFDRKKYGAIKVKSAQKGKIRKIIGSDDIIKAGVFAADVVLPECHPVEPSMEQQYMATHSESDWLVLKDILKQNYPDYFATAEQIFQWHSAHVYNMFIMRRELFVKYMDWMFAVLFEVADKITVSEDPYQRRVFGFLSERLLDVFLETEKKQNPGLKIVETPTLFIKD